MRSWVPIGCLLLTVILIVSAIGFILVSNNYQWVSSVAFPICPGIALLLFMIIGLSAFLSTATASDQKPKREMDDEKPKRG
jgi:hypothetical protein